MGAVGIVQKLRQSPLLKTTHMGKEIKNKKLCSYLFQDMWSKEKKKEVEFDLVLSFSRSERFVMELYDVQSSSMGLLSSRTSSPSSSSPDPIRLFNRFPVTGKHVKMNEHQNPGCTDNRCYGD